MINNYREVDDDVELVVFQAKASDEITDSANKSASGVFTKVPQKCQMTQIQKFQNSGRHADSDEEQGHQMSI